MKLVLIAFTLVAVANGLNVTGSGNSLYHSRQAKTFRMEKEKTLATNEVTQFFNSKNIARIIKTLVFGSSEESMATSRQVLSLLIKVLDMVKMSFATRNSRSASSGVRGLKDSIDDASVAGISMLKGFFRSALVNDTSCRQSEICEAAAAASRESRELGYLITQLGGYASSYVLDGHNTNLEAVRIGRSGGDCRQAFKCSHKEL